MPSLYLDIGLPLVYQPRGQREPHQLAQLQAGLWWLLHGLGKACVSSGMGSTFSVIYPTPMPDSWDKLDSHTC